MSIIIIFIYIFISLFLFTSDIIIFNIPADYIFSKIFIHDAFYPHPHMRDIKKLAQRGKILVITLVVSAGLIVLVSTALIKGDKDKNDIKIQQNINPSELRSSAVIAAIAARNQISRGSNEMIQKAFKVYSANRKIQHDSKITGGKLIQTQIIGNDTVTVKISESHESVEVIVESGKICAVATASVKNDSVKSRILSIEAVDRRGNIS
ncbi:hypothetical protein GF312_20700 [Candidatus Poribacteria bacterium]|nr:hypothetical protein [Candidatus Poribacteria bacterium]